MSRHLSRQETYRQHLATLDRYLTEALASAGRLGKPVDGVLFHAGRAGTYHADDRLIPFVTGAHFRRFVPPLAGPEHAALARPGSRLQVVRVRPRDYWYDTSPPPVSYWESEVDLAEASSFEEAVRLLGPLPRVAYVGDSPAAAAAAGIAAERVEPEELMKPLDWYRAYKTDHEVARIREAATSAAAGHRAAREAFDGGASELEIHWAYLRGSGQLEQENPYETIIALDEKAAILHYQHKRGPGTRVGAAPPGRTFLIDAGAASEGYAADLTRTWARPDVDPVFRALLAGVDAMERDLVAMVTAGRPYLEVHVAAHRRTADLLAATGIVKTGAEEAFDRGVTRTFLPHGVGHHLGLQVHDVGGHQAGPEGGLVPPPEEYPFLRNTRILEPGHVVTIEPGIYFIPMLLEPLRRSAEAPLVDWRLVDRLTPLGGIRIEDNVLCAADGPVDLSRELLFGP